MDSQNEQKLMIDTTVTEIDTGLEKMKMKSCIITVKDGYGDGMFYFYDEGNFSKLLYQPGEISEYYYFDKSNNLILAGTKRTNYQPYSIDTNNFYISNLKIIGAYKCTKTDDNDNCSETIIKDEQLISDFEDNIPDRLESFSKSLKSWPAIEKKLLAVAKSRNKS